MLFIQFGLFLNLINSVQLLVFRLNIVLILNENCYYIVLVHDVAICWNRIIISTLFDMTALSIEIKFNVALSVCEMTAMTRVLNSLYHIKELKIEDSGCQFLYSTIKSFYFQTVFSIHVTYIITCITKNTHLIFVLFNLSLYRNFC